MIATCGAVVAEVEELVEIGDPTGSDPYSGRLCGPHHRGRCYEKRIEFRTPAAARNKARQPIRERGPAPPELRTATT
jgi:hypothetical protein